MKVRDRRELLRCNVRIPLRFRTVGLASTSGEHRTESLNISRRGVFFISHVKLRVGTPIEISLRLPREVTGLDAVDARCFGRVTHARKLLVDGYIGYGVEIEKFTSPAYAEEWANWRGEGARPAERA